MQFLLLVYTDATMLDALPEGEFDTLMKGCLEKADALQREGKLLQFQQLEDARTARSVRIRDGRTRVSDGPFAHPPIAGTAAACLRAATRRPSPGNPS